MSASLVGLGDVYKRQTLLARARRGQMIPPGWPGLARFGLFWPRAIPPTVSYTHLTLPTICSV
eukprot:10372417-Alexandrium_andersonii.AAC.1